MHKIYKQTFTFYTKTVSEFKFSNPKWLALKDVIRKGCNFCPKFDVNVIESKIT